MKGFVPALAHTDASHTDKTLRDLASHVIGDEVQRATTMTLFVLSERKQCRRQHGLEVDATTRYGFLAGVSRTVLPSNSNAICEASNIARNNSAGLAFVILRSSLRLRSTPAAFSSSAS